MTDGGPPSSRLDPRLPVLVGVGVGGTGAPAAELMAVATERALADAGGRRLSAAVVSISVPQGSWSDVDPARVVARRVGARSARTELSELGIPQQRLVDDALAAISEGSDGVFVVTGGEARRFERGGRPGAEPVDAADATASSHPPPDVVHRRPGPLLEPAEVRHRLWEPVQQYAMIENALVAAEGRTPAEGRAETAALWEAFNRVARGNPRAAFPAPLGAEVIDTPSPDNRPLAFPYNKWHASQWTVDQAAALVLCSVGTARDHGVPPDRWVFPRVGLDSSSAVSLLARRHPHRWPAMGELGRAAALHLGRPVADCEVVEVYSCFPSAVRVQQRELALDPGAVPTVTGGMAFAGGPFNNFVLQATVAVVERLRGQAGAQGLVTTVSGLLTKPGLAVWSSRPDRKMPFVADLAERCARATEAVPVVDPEAGAPGVAADSPPNSATVVTFTTTYQGMTPHSTIAVCDLADGSRTVAMSDDPDVAAAATSEGIVGRAVGVEGLRFRLG